MPTIFRDRLYLDGQVYTIDCYPLDPWLTSLPERPLTRPTPFRQNGYVAAWAVIDDGLYLVEITGDAIAPLFAHLSAPVPAVWFSGFIRGWRGNWRHTGYPPRRFYDDEIVLEIASGKVTRAWVLELRTVPDQTDEELRLSLPRFLWPARLRDG
jgi:hypothetical protein